MGQRKVRHAIGRVATAEEIQRRNGSCSTEKGGAAASGVDVIRSAVFGSDVQTVGARSAEKIAVLCAFGHIDDARTKNNVDGQNRRLER